MTDESTILHVIGSLAVCLCVYAEHRLVTFAVVGQFFLGSKGRIAVDVGLISSQVGFCCVWHCGGHVYHPSIHHQR